MVTLKKDWKQKILDKILMRVLNARGVGSGGDFRTSGEVGVLRFLAATLPENAVIFDVGANVGDYSEKILEFMPGAMVHSFEPASLAYEALSKRKGIRLHKF